MNSLACRRLFSPAVRVAWFKTLGYGRWHPVTPATSNFSSLPDHIVVGMPALSPTMTHGGIGKWLKAEGDEIAPGDLICQLETDKATMDFEAQDDSFLAKILLAEGTQNVTVGTPICVTVDDAESVSAFKDFVAESVIDEASSPAVMDPPAATPTPPPTPVPAPTPTPTSIEVASPTPPAPSIPTVPSSASSAPDMFVFRREWGQAVRDSPLAHRIAEEQRSYVARYGSTLQDVLDP
ncbi:unnamed protein product [Choristocarpus tenellus]